MLLYTKEELPEVHEKALNELISYAGSVTHLAKMLGLEYKTVNSWTVRRRVSKNGCLLINSHPRLKDRFPASFIRPELEL